MNRQEIIDEYNIPKVLQSDDFKKAYREVRRLVDNKDRAYRRLVRGERETHRRRSTESTGTSIEST